jgi:hypothetical protein
MPGITSDTTKSAKQLAQQMAKQMAREPLEILKQGAEQIKGQESSENREPSLEVKRTNVSPEEKAKIQARGQRQIQALETELREIRNTKKQKEQVRQQQELMQQEAEAKEEKPLPVVSSKHSRRFAGFGRKAQAEKQQTRVEKPLPPSG